MNIVIPTYEFHYNYNFDFLKSFDRYCLDKEEVTINFIVNTHNIKFFETLKESFLDLNINFFTLQELMYRVDGEIFPDNESFFHTKFPLQSIKKLFAYTVVDSDYVVFDSENLCLKPFYFGEIFEQLKNKPLLYTNDVHPEMQREIVDNCNKIFRSNINGWFFIKSYWFYEKNYVELLIQELKKINGSIATNVLKNTIFFDYPLYCTFLLKNNLKEKLCVDDVMMNLNKECFSVMREKYLNKSHNFEYICTVLDDNNIDNYLDLINYLDERIVRVHWMPDQIRDKLLKEPRIVIGTFI